MSVDRVLIGFVAFSVAFVVAVIVLVIIWVAIWTSSFRQQCAESDGHIYQPGTIAWCLDDSGRVLEVYP